MKENILMQKADLFVKEVYRVSRQFPKDEIYGLTSQLRRASLSVPLNIVEGFARQSRNESHRFLDIAYASLKEVRYILYFAHNENYLKKQDYDKLFELAEDIGRIIWASMKTLKNNC